MAEVLTPPAQAGSRAGVSAWWPVDLVILLYLAAIGGLIAVYRARVPGAWMLLGAHAAGMLAIAGIVRVARESSAAWWTLRCWYPLPWVAACYREMSVLIPAIRGTDLDAELARLDYALWGTHPTVWLERLQTPALTEFLQVVYSAFVPMVLLVAALLWRRRPEAFRYYAFLVTLGFLTSYLGYLAVPARGPRFFLAHLQHVPLSGGPLFAALRSGLDVLESAHYDCFPSGHTELILIAWWTSRRISPNLFRTFSVYAGCMILATVYLRYHYTVDIFAGVALALALVAAAPRIERSMRTLLGT